MEMPSQNNHLFIYYNSVKCKKPEVHFDHCPDGTWCNWNASVRVRPQSALTQSLVPNQCD